MAERRSRAWWARTVGRWKRDGSTAAEFAARIGVSPRTLQWWSSTLGRGTRAERGSATPEPIEIELAAGAAQSADAAVEIAVGDAVVRVAAGADVEYVAALVRALGARR